MVNQQETIKAQESVLVKSFVLVTVIILINQPAVTARQLVDGPTGPAALHHVVVALRSA